MQFLGDKKFWAVGGGKGGVGKTVLTANLGLALAGRGKRVILVDADLGCANLHTVLGLKRTPHTLNDFLQKKLPLEEILLEVGIDNLRLISGANAILGLANPKYFQKQRIIRNLKKLPADYILLDLGAGTSYNMLDFFALADQELVVICPEPTSLQNGYGFIKSALYRKLQRTFSKNQLIMPLLQELALPKSKRSLKTMQDLLGLTSLRDENAAQLLRRQLAQFSPKIVGNMLGAEEDKESLLAIKLVAEKYLGIKLELIGNIYFHPSVSNSVKKMQPILRSNPDSQAAQEINRIVDCLLEGEKQKRI